MTNSTKRGVSNVPITHESMTMTMTMNMPLIVTIEASIDSESPCKYDGWKLYSFAKNRFITDVDPDQYVSGYDRFTGEVEPAIDELAEKLDTGLAYWLSYFEHSEGAWSLKGEGQQCLFDTAQLAGVLIWEDDANNLGPKSPEDRASDARRFLQRYNGWATGWLYDWNVREVGSDEPLAGVTECYDDVAMFSEIKVAVGDRAVLLRGNGAWLAEYHGDGLDVVEESKLLESVLSGHYEEPDVDNLTEHQEYERTDEYYGG